MNADQQAQPDGAQSSNNPTNDAPACGRAAVPPVGDRVVRGAVSTIGFSAGGKVATLLGQIALAWFLVPEDMGLVAMAMSVAGIVTILAAGHLRNIMVQKEKLDPDDVAQIFWLALGVNTVVGVLVACAAPVAAVVFKEDRVIPLVLILALNLPLMALPEVHAATLQRDLRFTVLAAILFGSGLIRMGGAVILAACHFGAYSIVLPMLPASIFLCVAVRVAAGRLPIGRPRPGKWKGLLAPAAWLMLNTLFVAARRHGVNFTIAAMKGSHLVGLYYWGFAVSAQAMYLISTNLSRVFFPALAKLGQVPERQLRGFSTACRTLTAIAAPVCLVQMLTARPLISLFFPGRWLPAVPVVFWLSFGLMTQPASVLGNSLLMAKGRYRLLSVTNAVIGAVAVAASVGGALTGGVDRIAMCMGVALFLTNLAPGYVALRSAGGRARDLLAVVGPPLALLIPSGLCGWFGSHMGRAWGPVAEIALACVTAGGAYSALAALAMPETAKDIITRLKATLRRKTAIEEA